MPYDAVAVANELLNLAREEAEINALDGGDGIEVDPMKLQKLVYLAHGWSLALEGLPLIDEQVEARPYGLIIPSVFDAFRQYGDGPITSLGITVEYPDDDADGPGVVVVPRVGDDMADESVLDLLEETWEVYGKYSSDQLWNLCNEDGSPWDLVRQEYGGQIPRGTDIPRSSIRDHFVKLSRATKVTTS